MPNSTQLGMQYIEELLSTINGVDYEPEREVALKSAQIALAKGITVSYTNGRTIYTPKLNTNKQGLQLPRAVEVGLRELNAEIVMDVGYAKRGVLGVLITIWHYQKTYYIEYLHVAKNVLIWSFANKANSYANVRQNVLHLLNSSLAQFSPVIGGVYNALVATMPSCLPLNKPKEYVACVIPI